MESNTPSPEARNLSPKEQYDIRKADKLKEKQAKKVQEKRARIPKTMWKYVVITVIVVGIVAGLGWLLTLVPNLPPTTAEGHNEDSPEAHIVRTAIPDRIQRHMLEHSDGSGAPGVLIQYNCTDYECESGLIEQLTTLVREYPENVYLAPNTYDGKIILTRIGQREVLDTFEEDTIRAFIE